MRPSGLTPIALAAAFAVVSVTSTASADGADKRARAASEYDAGAQAFKKKDFEAAAAHFEAADAAMPNASALRQSIRARSEAGQAARAATLATLALQRHPNDGPLSKIAKDAIEKYEIVLHKVHVVCSEPCTVTAGGLVVPGEAKTRWEVYLDPGAGKIEAAFAEGTASKDVEAKAGGESDVRLDAKKKAPPPVVAPVPVPSPETPPPDDPKPEEEKKDDAPRKGISPAFFGVGAAAFVGLGAATIWSGVDTLHNPGQAAVKAQCVGLGTACPAYQEGVAHQQRTNILAGVTGGVGVVTILLGVFTNWRGGKKAEREPAAEPTAIVTDRGGTFGARGVF